MFQLGEGTNACYIEKQKNVELFDEENLGSGVVIIDTGWAGFGNDGSLNFVVTNFDREVDDTTINHGKEL